MIEAASWTDLGRLVPWKENPRDNTLAIEEVAQSLIRFGFATPIVARQADGMIIAGHTRSLAAALLPGIWKRSKPKDRTKWHPDAVRMATNETIEVPVRFLDLSVSEAKALALADNKLGEISSWDDSKLRDVLAELSAEGTELEGLGFDDALLAELSETAASAGTLLAGEGEPADNPPEITGTDERPERTGARTDFAPVLKWNVVFQTSEQQDRWFAFLRALKEQYPSQETVCGRLDEHVTRVLADRGEP